MLVLFADGTTLSVENMKESIGGTRTTVSLARLQNVRSIKIKNQL